MVEYFKHHCGIVQHKQSVLYTNLLCVDIHQWTFALAQIWLLIVSVLEHEKI